MLWNRSVAIQMEDSLLKILVRLWCLRWEGLNPKLFPKLSFLSVLHRCGCSENSLKDATAPCTSNGAAVLEKSLKDVAIPDHLPLSFTWCDCSGEISQGCGLKVSNGVDGPTLESSRFLCLVFQMTMGWAWCQWQQQ